MKFINNFSQIKLGDKIAWLFIDGWEIVKEKYNPEDKAFFCLTQVKGFYKKTNYPRNKLNGHIYTTKEMINHQVLAKVTTEKYSPIHFLLNINYKDEFESGYVYDKKYWECYLIENEQDQIDIIKHIMVTNL